MIIGIDLGTTNSLAAVFRDGRPELIPNALGQFLTPSVVGLDDKGNLVVGAAAKDQLITQPERTTARFKRLMGTQQVTKLGRQKFSPEELSALVLRSLVADAQAYLGAPVTEAIISVPAYFNDPQRKATQRAAQMAGLKVRRLINEPTAAALAYGLNDRDGESTFLVFDLGGGTFDVSILELFEGVMEVRASAGDAFLGGEDFTDELAKVVAERMKITKPGDLPSKQIASLRRQADQIKVALTERTETEAQVTVGKQSETLTFDRADIETAAKPLLARLRRPLERAMSDAGLKSTSLDRIVLVGGASRMASVKALVTKLFGRFPEFDIDPDHVVGLGAAVQAGLASRDEALEDIVMTDVCPFTLGVESSERISATQLRGDLFVPIIERNSAVPISREHTFSTASDYQTEVHFKCLPGRVR